MQDLTLPAWMGEIDLSRIGFPLPVDKSRYTKKTGIPYKETPSGALLLDFYRPADVARPPLVLMIHGGGWARGGRFEMGLSKWAGYLANAGLAVASIDYRLAPAAQYPEPFLDCLDAFDWLVEHAGELGVDAQRVGLWGDSAGGHLVLLLATSQTHPAFGGPRMRSSAERIRGVVGWYPPTNLLRLHRGGRKNGLTTVMDFVGCEPDADPRRWSEVSPLEHVHPKLPPMLLLQGTRDLLVPHTHTVAFAEKLAEIGAPHELHVVENALHGFDRLDPGPQALRLIERTREFLVERLGGD